MADERGRVDMGNDEDVIIMLAEMISAEEEHGDGFGPDPTVIQQFLEEHDVGPERFKALAAEFVSYIEASEGWRWEEIVAVLDVFGFKTMIALQRRHVHADGLTDVCDPTECVAPSPTGRMGLSDTESEQRSVVDPS